MQKLLQCLCLFSLNMVAVSCQKNSADPVYPSTTAQTPAENRKLKIQVNKVVSYSPYREFGLDNAEVRLYASTIDCEQGAKVLHFAKTTLDGYAELSHVKPNQYYMRVQHLTFGVIDQTVSLPQAAVVSFQTVVFP